jgi:hypothetical protein
MEKRYNELVHWNDGKKLIKDIRHQVKTTTRCYTPIRLAEKKSGKNNRKARSLITERNVKWYNHLEKAIS